MFDWAPNEPLQYLNQNRIDRITHTHPHKPTHTHTHQNTHTSAVIVIYISYLEKNKSVFSNQELAEVQIIVGVYLFFNAFLKVTIIILCYLLFTSHQNKFFGTF